MTIVGSMGAALNELRLGCEQSIADARLFDLGAIDPTLLCEEL